MDLVRALLLFFEQRAKHDAIRSKDITIDGYESQQVQYHLIRMFEAGLLSAEAVRSTTTPERIVDVIPFDLTWQGHQLIETVRNPEVWEKTKEGAKRVGGVAIEFVWEMAKAYTKHQIKQKLGIEVG
jgi:hypothetical protein